ncbi:putative ribonuclease mrp protein subunit rmp1 [Diplocarpon rosae]|nr:putative ribonuclease mrp protein subunit rmp1 [Diplocarpon rosae]
MHSLHNPNYPMAHSPVLLSTPSKASSDPSLVQDLQELSQLLHLTHHRNKNQHRLAKWYKPFSQLRRQLLKLIAEAEVLETALKFSTSSVPAKIEEREQARGKEKGKYVKAAEETVGMRVRFLEEMIVPKCFTAFSNVVADGQYAALGLFLVATLASVQTVMRRLVRSEVGRAEVMDEKYAPKSARDLMMNLTEVDLGEAVTREDVMNGADVATPEPGKEEKKMWKQPMVDIGDEYELQTPPKKRAKTKRKKGGDAFDIMFAGLI